MMKSEETDYYSTIYQLMDKFVSFIRFVPDLQVKD